MQATGLATLEHSPSVVLFEALQKRADDIKDDFSEEQIQDLKKAYSKLGYEDYGKKIWAQHETCRKLYLAAVSKLQFVTAVCNAYKIIGQYTARWD